MGAEIVERRSAADVRRILELLPEWFGDPEAISNYAAAAEDGRYGSMLAIDGTAVKGVALVRRHFPEAAELHLIAVEPGSRGMGIGRKLVEHVVADLASDGCRVLSVHTVGPSFEDAAYAETRAFYRSAGFIPLEEHTGLDWGGPTLILVRPLGPHRS